MSIFCKSFINSLLVTWVVFSWNTTLAFQDSLSATPYHVPVKDKFFVKPQFTLRHTGFFFRDSGKEGRVQYFSLPNYLSTGLSLYLFDLKMAVNYQVNRKPGTGGRFDIQTLWTSKRLGADLVYVKQGLTTTDFRELPLDTRSIWLGGYYVFNYRHFSMAPGLNQTVLQQRSAGSFLLSTILSSYKAASDQSLVDAGNQPYFGDLADMRSLGSVTWGLMAGYGYTMVYNDWYITGVAMMGPGHYWQRYGAVQDTERDLQFGLLTSLKGMAGYQGETWFFGGIFQSQLERVNNDALIYQWNQFSLRLFVGRRFTERGFTTKSVNDIFSKK